MIRLRLKRWSSWFGVNVHVVRGAAPRLQAHCRVADAVGTVSGAIRIEGHEWLLTCRHVTAAACSCSAPGVDGLWIPDAVLLRPDGRCFPVLTEASPVRWCTQKEVDNWREDKTEVVLHGSSRAGHVFSVGLVSYGDKLKKFPNYEVHRYRLTFLGIPIPFTRKFSRPGDSGSWVLGREHPDQWIGMHVAAGGHVAYGHCSGPLLQWFHDTQGASPRAGFRRNAADAYLDDGLIWWSHKDDSGNMQPLLGRNRV